MSKNRVSLVVDLLAYLAMAVLIATGVILHYRLPPHSRSDVMLGLSRHEWGGIHFYVALFLLVVVVLHIILHWKWVTHTFGALFGGEGRPKPAAGLGGATLLVVLGLVLAGLVAASWVAPVSEGSGGKGDGEGKGKGYRGGRASGDEAGAIPQATAGSGSDQGRANEGSPTAAPALTPHGKGAEGSQDIRGNSTIADAAAAAGMPVARLLAELKLPPDTSPTENLGRLRQEHGFTLAQVRDLVARLKAESKPEK